MSSRRKSPNPGVLRATCSNAGDSVEKDGSEAVLDRYSPVAPTTDESWPSLNNEEAKRPEASSASYQGLVRTRDHGDHADLPQPEDQGNFRTKFDSLSCHIEHEEDGSLQETEDTNYDLGQCELSNGLAEGEDAVKMPMENNSILEKGLEVEKDPDSPGLKDEIRAVNINGTIIIPELTCHVTPLLQRPPNLSTSPTIAVPLHTSKYNPILDSNPTLITSFNRFPYPTHAELSWLTASSKHPEEQIKVWFTIQRLKQGITWSPEEVEEARKKMFNGSIPPTHQTCTISPVGEPLKPRQAASQVLGQNSLASNNTATQVLTACRPGIATAVRQTVKNTLGTPLLAAEVKRPAVPPIGDPREYLYMPPPPAPLPERLAIASCPGLSETRTSNPVSLVASGMVKRPVAAHFVTPKERLQMVQAKEKIPVSLTSVLPKERLPLTPIASANLKRSLIQVSNHTLASLFVPKIKFPCFGDCASRSSAPGVTSPQVSRPTIIQTLAAVPLSPLLQPAEPSIFPMVPCFSSQNGKEIPHMDGKHWFLDQTTNSQNSKCGEFVSRESLVPSQFPLLERVKDKSPGQMKLLEESFQRNSFPSFNEVEHLMIFTRLSREEIESWFLERRALRDDLEQALLNSMGSKWESQQMLLNGAQKCSGTLTFSPVPQDSKSMNRLKNVFVQSRWPSPVEFRHLEMQTRLARTELVQWDRDGRLAQQSCILDRKEVFGERNGFRTADTSKQIREENTKPSSPAMENWLDNTLAQHTESNGKKIAEGTRGWNTSEMLSDSD